MHARPENGWVGVWPARRLVPLLLVLAVGGCGGRSGIERVAVSGSVSYRGEPVEVGQIRFIPVESTRAPVTVENIRGGAYKTETSGGVPVGDFRVEIRMYDAEEYLTGPRVAGSPAAKQLLPDKYNRDSELRMSIASGSRAIRQDFSLED